MRNRWAVILGGNSDLATETLRRLRSRSELRFFVHHRSSSPALDELKGLWGERMVLHQADLQDETAVVDMTARILRDCESPAVFIQFAAPPLEIHRFKESSTKAFLAAFTVQTVSSAIILRSLLSKMRGIQDGDPAQVIFVSSEVVRNVPPKGMAEYVVGKYAMLGLMRALSAEFERPMLRFHAIAPGMMDTKFLKGVPNLAVEAARAQRRGDLESVHSVAEKLVALVQNPDALLGDALYLR